MKLISICTVLCVLSGCATWDELEPAEKVAVGVGAAVIVGAAIIRNGNDPVTINQCYAHHSVDTDCVTGHR